jgi:hypothetical protein
VIVKINKGEKMYILNVTENGKSCTKIFEVDNEGDRQIQEKDLKCLFGGGLVDNPTGQYFSKPPVMIEQELVLQVIKAIKKLGSSDATRSDLTGTESKELEAQYNLTNYEVSFISSIVGRITCFAKLTQHYEECGIGKSLNAGFWLKIASEHAPEGEWISVEDFCNGEIVMGYVKPCEIVTYIHGLQHGFEKVS